MAIGNAQMLAHHPICGMTAISQYFHRISGECNGMPRCFVPQMPLSPIGNSAFPSTC